MVAMGPFQLRISCDSMNMIRLEILEGSMVWGGMGVSHGMKFRQQFPNKTSLSETTEMIN